MLMYATGLTEYLFVGKGLGLVRKTAQETQCPHKMIPITHVFCEELAG